MSSLNTGLKSLRNSVGALTLGFLMAACGSNPPVKEAAKLAPVPVPAAAPAVKVVTATTMSTMLADIEREANEYVRSAAAAPKLRVAIIDADQVNTFTGTRQLSSSEKLRYYLKERGINLGSNDFSAAYMAMGDDYGPRSGDPQALHFVTTDARGTEPDLCLISPATADVSSRSMMEEWIGQAGNRFLQTSIDPGAYLMALRLVWHEAWHCMDDDFVHAYNAVDKDAGLENAKGVHRSEMFADVAATLTLASKGYPDIMRDTADARAVFSRWYGPKMMAGGREDYSPEHDYQYYTGANYYSTPAHDAALAHIRAVGIERVKQYSLTDIRRIATEITLQHALTAKQFRALSDYLKQGNEYLDHQEQQAAQGNADAQENVAFLNEYIARTNAAKTRIAIETARTIPPFVDRLPPKMDEILQNVSTREKEEIFRAMEKAVNAAVSNGQSARQGIFSQIEAWRQQIHTSPARQTGLERKLYLASLMLACGHMDQLMSPAPVPAALVLKP